MIEVDGVDFVIERLGQGSVINHRLVFTNDLTFMNIRCSKNTTVFLLSKFELLTMLYTFEDLFTKVHLYIDKILHLNQ